MKQALIFLKRAMVTVKRKNGIVRAVDVAAEVFPGLFNRLASADDGPDVPPKAHTLEETILKTALCMRPN